MGKHDGIVLDTVSCVEKYDSATSISGLRADDEIEIALVVKGNGIHQVINQSIPCKVGDIYIVPPHIPHRYFCGEECSELEFKRIKFDCSRFVGAEFSVPGEHRFCYGIFKDSPTVAYAMLNSRTNEDVGAIFGRIADEINNNDGEWIEAVKAHLTLLMITLSRYVNSAIIDQPALPPKEWHVVSQTVKAVTERFSETQLTLESISEALYVSKSYLSKIFIRTFGEAFSDYLRKVRMAHACRLLQSTPLTVEEIVLKCGLKDIPSFYRNFQSATGMTPIQYRKRIAEQQESVCENDVQCFDEISEAVRSGGLSRIRQLITDSINNGANASDLLDAMLRGMSLVGEKFKNNEVYVPEVLVAARAMNAGLEILKPVLADLGSKKIGRACLGTVRGDLHDIGKNLVKIMMEGKGIEVIDLGTDVAPEVFVTTAIEKKCQIICCSALLTTTMGVIGEVVELADKAGIRDKVKIMIGGAPISKDFCEQIGADSYTDDAASAADEAVMIIKSLTAQ